MLHSPLQTGPAASRRPTPLEAARWWLAFAGATGLLWASLPWD